MTRQQREFYRLFSEHGSGEAKVIISPQEVLMLLLIATSDLGIATPPIAHEIIAKVAEKGFYHISTSDTRRLPHISPDECYRCLEITGVTNVNDILFLYFKNLCDLYRRRVKYYHIFQLQPFPNADQIVPRSLLEYGNCDNKLLANWLEWRKWIFDIDNRSAQETGYVFEPILAGCLGGESVSSINSPVKRIDEKGVPTSKGRQVDCYIPERGEVYELKMRVTVAASGQGRFNEEMSFPSEAQIAGLTPILIVFDSNESNLLVKLKARYMECGGKCYIGSAAWAFLRERSGREMGIFIDKYIFPPINTIEQLLDSNPKEITVRQDADKIIISNGVERYIIDRES